MPLYWSDDGTWHHYLYACTPIGCGIVSLFLGWVMGTRMWVGKNFAIGASVFLIAVGALMLYAACSWNSVPNEIAIAGLSFLLLSISMPMRVWSVDFFSAATAGVALAAAGGPGLGKASTITLPCYVIVKGLLILTWIGIGGKWFRLRVWVTPVCMIGGVIIQCLYHDGDLADYSPAIVIFSFELLFFLIWAFLTPSTRFKPKGKAREYYPYVNGFVVIAVTVLAFPYYFTNRHAKKLDEGAASALKPLTWSITAIILVLSLLLYMLEFTAILRESWDLGIQDVDDLDADGEEEENNDGEDMEEEENNDGEDKEEEEKNDEEDKEEATLEFLVPFKLLEQLAADIARGKIPQGAMDPSMLDHLAFNPEGMIFTSQREWEAFVNYYAGHGELIGDIADEPNSKWIYDQVMRVLEFNQKGSISNELVDKVLSFTKFRYTRANVDYNVEARLQQPEEKFPEDEDEDEDEVEGGDDMTIQNAIFGSPGKYFWGLACLELSDIKKDLERVGRAPGKFARVFGDYLVTTTVFLVLCSRQTEPESGSGLVGRPIAALRRLFRKGYTPGSRILHALVPYKKESEAREAQWEEVALPVEFPKPIQRPYEFPPMATRRVDAECESWKDGPPRSYVKAPKKAWVVYNNEAMEVSLSYDFAAPTTVLRGQVEARVHSLFGKGITDRPPFPLVYPALGFERYGYTLPEGVTLRCSVGGVATEVPLFISPTYDGEKHLAAYIRPVEGVLIRDPFPIKGMENLRLSAYHIGELCSSLKMEVGVVDKPGDDKKRQLWFRLGQGKEPICHEPHEHIGPAQVKDQATNTVVPETSSSSSSGSDIRSRHPHSASG